MALIDDVIYSYALDDDAANTTVVDAEAANNGTATTNTSNLQTASGKFGYGFDLNGTTEFVNLPHLTELAVGSNYSINMWINPDNISTDRCLISNANGTNDRVVMMFRNSELAVRSYGGSGSDVNTRGSYTPGTGVLAMVTLVHNSDNSIALYVNNSLVSGGSEQASTSATTVTKIGVLNNGTSYKFDGIISNVDIFNVALTSQNRSDLYAGGSGNPYPFSAGPDFSKIKVNIADVWKDGADMFINVGDDFKQVTEVWINIGDVFKQVV